MNAAWKGFLREETSLHRLLLKYIVNCPVLLLSLRHLFQGCFVGFFFLVVVHLKKNTIGLGSDWFQNL